MGLNVNMYGKPPAKGSIWANIKAARGIKKSLCKRLEGRTVNVNGFPGKIDELKLTIPEKIKKYNLTILASSSPSTDPLLQVEPTDIDVGKPHATITKNNFDGWVSSYNVDGDGAITTHINVLESVQEDLQLVLDGLSHEQTQQIQWIVNHNPNLHIVTPPKAAEDASPLMGQPDYTIDMDDMLLTALSPALAR